MFLTVRLYLDCTTLAAINHNLLADHPSACTPFDIRILDYRCTGTTWLDVNAKSSEFATPHKAAPIAGLCIVDDARRQSNHEKFLRIGQFRLQCCGRDGGARALNLLRHGRAAWPG